MRSKYTDSTFVPKFVTGNAFGESDCLYDTKSVAV